MNIDFNKSDGLVPVIIQDEQTLEVLMLGYMNQEAYDKTVQENIVTFYSRSKNRLWTKGETSQNYLHVKSMHIDCDNDTLLIKVKADGPTCHTGSRSCFQTEYNQNFLMELENIIGDRFDNPQEGSYINKLRKKGLKKITQKVGEEGVEVVIAALHETDVELIDESSDLLFHLMVLLREKGLSLATIAKNLESRHK
ncbi:bifunctional phosphoribosyl-AMP cyclohydrolase/phosphoribosyl-ATP diphosphatase HisIE [Mucilaginibacter pallidiroseus]|uniref:Histidine biosynthesis bifunctional protein HisIE n=1 Tax=Mucilaginibacter pallidiroseus TaxID=2599295 RepID=A0A563UCD2_9SPHI|nr:bifunctional phosphoribosyl-AMP cyclohydrolase/phosphoribosyl-ATP diphosphatase HisIE [Mucilaginibacter pallidiroseus]TWR29027.1 bifunctional phosphoribosyl-AMP cyclohydrolase/phosphoribosyl-ATP diphosphatase HisIE [Mucilaginibacter pallidiroseus]